MVLINHHFHPLTGVSPPQNWPCFFLAGQNLRESSGFMGNMLIEGMLRYVELGGLLDEMRF